MRPKQIAALNEVFTLSEEEIICAQRVIAEFEEAYTGLVVIDSKSIEKPVLRKMHRIFAVADQMQL